MKGTLALISAALAVSACTRTIEREVPVATPPVVVTPSAASGATGTSCAWNGQPTSNGGVSCQSGTQYRCNNGTWERTASYCSQ
jgi:hypothetical protein